MLGVTVSEAPAQEAISFSVPAHVFATLNVVLHGTLSHHRQLLPHSFATGGHTRSRRYALSPGAILLTLFCRADALADLSGQDAASFTDTWLPGDCLFRAWSDHRLRDTRALDPMIMAQALLDCVAPAHLPPLGSTAVRDALPDGRLRTALHELAEHPLPIAASRLRISERGLQRLFLTQWGINPKRVQRMLRIQRAVALWDSGCRGLAELAAQTGLVDQAHLAREFRQLVGYPPSSLKRSPRAVSEDLSADALWALRTGRALLPLLMQ